MEKINKPQNVSLLIRHAHILTMDAGNEVFEDGAIAVSGNKITAIGNTVDLEQLYIAEQTIDAAGCIVIPGLINAHTHIPMTYFRGLADDMEFNEWLFGFIIPLEQKLVDHDFTYDATLHGAAELIKNGITLANDMYFESEAMAQAITKAGLRCIIGDPVLGTALKNDDDIRKLGSAAIINSKKYKTNPLLDFSLAPHAISTNNKAILQMCTEVALQNDLLVHMHLSETMTDINICRRKYSSRPVHFLRDIGLLDARIIMAHGIRVNEEEMDILSEHNASIAICTESNLKLANGFAPISNYLKHKVRCCFGTDGVASNNNQDLLAELDLTAKVHKNINHDPTFLPAEQMLKMATIEAAKAVHKDSEIGSLETGKLADLVILDCNAVEAQPLYNPYSQVIYALGGRAVRDVIINGKLVLRDKKLTTLDETEILATAQKYKAMIKKELKK
ncbi:MAG: amidohydrolase family protein [Candidatus Cloacimonadaceae bacterium]